MFCVQYVNDHSRMFLSAYEEHYIFSLSILCQSVFCPYYVLLLCRLLPVQNFYLVLFTLLVPFIQPVPFLLYLFLFGLSLYKFACLFLCFLVYFFIQACIFLSTLYLFYPKPLSKKTQPSVSITLIRVGRNCIIYFCSYLVVSFFLI